MRGATRARNKLIREPRISIHAPLAGCDSWGNCPHPSRSQFQSTHPLRGATLVCHRVIRVLVFQSTHPLRGATSVVLRLRVYQIDFNPRTPCGVRLGDRRGVVALHVISIHAPLAGCDSVTPSPPTRTIYFNPRTPCGVRQQNCRNIPGKFAQKLQNFCKAEQRAALPRVGQRESGRYFRPCAVRTSRGKPERFRFASDNERALRSVARLCAEVLDAGFILVSKVIKA